MHFTRWRSQGTGGAWSWTPPGIGKRWPLGVGCETIWCSGVARTDPDNNDVDTLVEIASTPLLGYNLSPWISRFSLLRQGSARWPIMTRILKLRVGTRIPETQTLVSMEFKTMSVWEDVLVAGLVWVAIEQVGLVGVLHVGQCSYWMESGIWAGAETIMARRSWSHLPLAIHSSWLTDEAGGELVCCWLEHLPDGQPVAPWRPEMMLAEKIIMFNGQVGEEFVGRWRAECNGREGAWLGNCLEVGDVDHKETELDGHLKAGLVGRLDPGIVGLWRAGFVVWWWTGCNGRPMTNLCSTP